MNDFARAMGYFCVCAAGLMLCWMLWHCALEGCWQLHAWSAWLVGGVGFGMSLLRRNRPGLAAIYALVGLSYVEGIVTEAGITVFAPLSLALLPTLWGVAAVSVEDRWTRPLFAVSVVLAITQVPSFIVLSPPNWIATALLGVAVLPVLWWRGMRRLAITLAAPTIWMICHLAPGFAAATAPYAFIVNIWVAIGLMEFRNESFRARMSGFPLWSTSRHRHVRRSGRDDQAAFQGQRQISGAPPGRPRTV